MTRLIGSRKATAATEYGFMAALIVLALVFVLPAVAGSLEVTIVTLREGLKGKACEGDPTRRGTQCR